MPAFNLSTIITSTAETVAAIVMAILLLGFLRLLLELVPHTLGPRGRWKEGNDDADDENGLQSTIHAGHTDSVLKGLLRTTERVKAVPGFGPGTGRGCPATGGELYH